MAAEVQEPLTKVDSATGAENKGPKRRASSIVEGVYSMEDLQKENQEVRIAIETQKLNWKVNTSPNSIDDKDYLKKKLTDPPVRKIDLKFPLGLKVTARNKEGVTIKDAMDAIHKQYKKKADDELDEPYLRGFEFDTEESWTEFIVHLKKTGEPISSGGGKKKKAKAEES